MKTSTAFALATAASTAVLAQQTILHPSSQEYQNDPLIVQVDAGDLYYDQGGSTLPYILNSDTQLNMVGAGGSLIEVEITTYQIETGFDFLFVHDGPDKSAPQLGILTGSSATPQTFTATTSAGLTFRFFSDYTQREPGWSGIVTKAGPKSEPVACTGFLSPFDKTIDATKKARAIPVKLVADVPSGAAAPVVNVMFAGETNENIVGYDAELLPNSFADSSNTMTLNNDGEWQLNISTKPYTTEGVYTVQSVAGDSSYELVGCSAQQFIK